MKKFSVSYIRRWLVLLLVLVILTTLATYLLTYAEIIRTLSSHMAASSKAGSLFAISNDAPLAGLRIRLLMLLSGSALVICALGYLWMGLVARRLNRPLRIISKALSRLARGKLNETVAIDAPDEFAKIGSGINELAANLQELLLYIWKQSGQCLEQIKRLEQEAKAENNARHNAILLEHIQELYAALDDLRDMAKAYVFYDVHLAGDQTLANTEPGHFPPPVNTRRA
jgi:methyl-accepting chemotaxis protein